MEISSLTFRREVEIFRDFVVYMHLDVNGHNTNALQFVTEDSGEH